MLGTRTAPERLPLGATFIMSTELNAHHTHAVRPAGVLPVSFQGQQSCSLSFSIHRLLVNRGPG